MSGLAERTLRNLALAGALRVGSVLANSVALLVLVRLLTPYEFGVIGVATVFLAFAAQFSDFGLGAAVVQRRGDVHISVENAATLRLLLASLLVVITFFMAPFLAGALRAPETADVIRFLSILWIVAGAGFIPYTVLWKQLEFRVLTLVGIASAVISAVVSILLAVGGFGYWSVAVGTFAGSSANAGLLWLFRPWSFRFRLDKHTLLELLRFGKYMFALNLIVLTFQAAENLFIGATLGVVALGVYYVATKWAMFVTAFVMGAVGTVLFPTYTTIRDDVRRLSRGFLQSMRGIALLALPAQFATVILAPNFVIIVLGPAWIPSVRAMQILALVGLVSMLLLPIGDLFLATGNSKWLTGASLVNLVILLTLILPAIQYAGLTGVAILVLGIIVQHAIVLLWLVLHHFPINFREILRAWKVAFVAVAFMAAPIIVGGFVVGDSLPLLIAVIAIGALVYISAVRLLDREFFLFLTRAGLASLSSGREPPQL